MGSSERGREGESETFVPQSKHFVLFKYHRLSSDCVLICLFSIRRNVNSLKKKIFDSLSLLLLEWAKRVRSPVYVMCVAAWAHFAYILPSHHNNWLLILKFFEELKTHFEFVHH